MKISKRSMQGLSMIEVLVTVVILALGILGTSALQIMALKGTDSAHYRTVATFIANEMAERIRTNPAGVASGGYETDTDAPINCSPISENTVDCNSTNCTSSQLAFFDQVQLMCGHVNQTTASNANASWQTAIKAGVVNSLPRGSLSINCGVGCGSNVDHVITVSWIERADHEDQVVQNSSIVLTITP